MKVAVALAFLAAVANAASFSAEDQAIWIDRHNYFRTTGLPWAAGDMRRIGWSDDLATSAASTAAQCSGASAAGVNVFQSSASNSSSIIDEAIQQWVVETSMTTLKTLPQPGTVGVAVGTGVYNSYSQVLWDSTTSVGCATSSCSGGDMVVCEYSPAGNDPSSPWYVHGETASDCPSGTTASQGLCIVEGDAANDQIAPIPAGKQTYEVYPAYVANMQTLLIEVARAIASGSTTTTGSATQSAPAATTAASTDSAIQTATTPAPATSSNSQASSSGDDGAATKTGSTKTTTTSGKTTASSSTTDSSSGTSKATKSGKSTTTTSSSTTDSSENDTATKQTSQTSNSEASSSDESAPGTVKASSDTGSTFTNQAPSTTTESSTKQSSTASSTEQTSSSAATAPSTASAESASSITNKSSTSGGGGISAAGFAGMIVLAVVGVAAFGVVMSYKRNQRRQREIMRDGGIRII
ncbi:hypothetical protein PHYSODRAFT_503134 [Phytophthora sojae]|uniref:SCP domain-containing protein n=1 Tax=Phytophthora sojae (strain P6497) TaxID=1094619 RepID=G4ZJT7_PHYSP|nr:hypothetical protein PHYSODRAFT_503134 [Phytophthora sojae]EGZ18898.1 hypothetical protein PHYSODRAFT_503134 [Phytophthora sojae]|eukprot:XP_009527956.1 hypothetical protein PHYSODRAFT_503134 [Phytophthora sojae]